MQDQQGRAGETEVTEERAEEGRAEIEGPKEAGLKAAGPKAAGPKRPEAEESQTATAGGHNVGMVVAGQEGDGSMAVCLCVLGCVEGE